MELNDIKTGLKVKITKIEDTEGMLVAKKHLDARELGAIGMVMGYVPGHGGDVWWVKHGNGTIGAYTFDEFDPLK